MQWIKNLFYKKSVFLEVVGFDSPHEFLLTVMGIKEKNLIPAIAISISGILVLLSKLIDSYIFSPALGIWILMGLTAADIVLGCATGRLIKEQKIDAWRMSKAGVRFIVQIFFVAMLYQTSFVWTIIGKWVVDALLFLFTLSTFWSAFENAHKLGLISNEVYSIVEGFLSISKMFNRVFGHKINQDAIIETPVISAPTEEQIVP